MGEKIVSSCFHQLCGQKKYFQFPVSLSFQGDQTCLSLIISRLPSVGSTQAAYLLMTCCRNWPLPNPLDRHRRVENPAWDQIACVIYAAAYLGAFMEMCFLLSAPGRCQSWVTHQRVMDGAFRVCLGSAVCEPGAVRGTIQCSPPRPRIWHVGGEASGPRLGAPHF